MLHIRHRVNVNVQTGTDPSRRCVVSSLQGGDFKPEFAVVFVHNSSMDEGGALIAFWSRVSCDVFGNTPPCAPPCLAVTG